MKRPITKIISLFFGFLCLGHVARAFLHFSIEIGYWIIPQWVSYAAVPITAFIAFQLWQESEGHGLF